MTPERQDLKGKKVCKAKLGPKAPREKPAHRDLPVLLARKERLVRKANRANRSLMMISPRSSLRR